MAKYSDVFKLMVVREYLDGPLGLTFLVRKYDIKSHSQLSNWVNVYQKYGAKGLSRKKKSEIYSVQFKLDVLSFMKRTGVSQTSVGTCAQNNNEQFTQLYKNAKKIRY
ncbi:transposase [Sporosarcina sp. E16_8]|uniref:transposase n=1 Tax=Sporosarcina sp. E16_8 TaxID=2789295 RepID=UPI001A936AD7|nr:transposase [Sporosarcina sp. E16_8]MBO0589737.1 transposase [Sporosarcina sp. E16_8]